MGGQRSQELLAFRAKLTDHVFCTINSERIIHIFENSDSRILSMKMEFSGQIRTMLSSAIF